MLVQLAEEWNRLQGFTQLASDSELENTGSIAFHQKSGFEETNRVVCFIKELSLRPTSLLGEKI